MDIFGSINRLKNCPRTTLYIITKMGEKNNDLGKIPGHLFKYNESVETEKRLVK